ncbi:MAG: DUF4932 domain-containing protein [Rikenellaceae bacterium]|nr:DUF4932 domain-containing protein [Rikenellaceae bacterium]
MKNRRLRTLLILFCSSTLLLQGAFGQRNEKPENGRISLPTVHPNVELVEIIARLAEISSHSTENHSQARNPYYVAAIEEYFAPYKDHPAVEYMRYLARERYLSYNAIPEIGPYFTPAPEFQPRVRLEDQQLDARWEVEEAYELIRLAADFYTDTDCARFFASQQDRYARAVEGMIPVYEKLDVEWFSRFFGTTELNSGFYPIIAPGQGEFNYGGPAITFPDGREEIYAIVASIAYDSLGYPQKVDTAMHISLLVHEFAHSFVNPMQKIHTEVLRKEGEQLFHYVVEFMTRQAYGYWTSVLNESLVWACEVRYLMAHGADSAAVSKKIKQEQNRGFSWMPELVALLDEYEANRDAYPTLEHFIPRMAELYESIATGYAEQPQVSHIGPFENGSREVDPATAEIHLYFTHPMQGKGYSIKVHPALADVSGYSGQEHRCFTFKVRLEPQTDYHFEILEQGFRTPDGTPILPYHIRFRTGDARQTDH